VGARRRAGGHILEGLLAAVAGVEVADQVSLLFGRTVAVQQLLQAAPFRTTHRMIHGSLKRRKDPPRIARIPRMRKAKNTSERGGHVLRAFAFHGGLPESLPGLRVKLVADLLGGEAEHLPLVLPVPEVRAVVRRGLLLQAVLAVGITAAPLLAAAGVEEVVQL